MSGFPIKIFSEKSRRNLVTSLLKFKTIFLILLVALTACSDFISPVKSTPTPTEYSFNYWLLQKIYLYEDELPNLPKDGDSVQILYNTLKDPYTRYVPPSKSKQTIIAINTSMVAGDVGMRYYTNNNVEYPIYITRVYPQSPAGRAGVPRYGNILSVNDIELTGLHAKATYDSILNYNKKISLTIAYNGQKTTYNLEKETIYAPTVFVDTLFEDSTQSYPGIVFITIENFKPTTADQNKGTYGELKAYLDSTTSEKRVRVLDLRNNPGGHVNQCLDIADLFVKSGTLSTRKWRLFTADGRSKYNTKSVYAKPGDPGEDGKFIILANRGSASCSEIFISAITETTDIPFVGAKTYGKGIGQTNFSTFAGGLAIITDLEFLTPTGKSYHGIGISPKYECSGAVSEECAAQFANKLYNVKIPKLATSLAKQADKFTDDDTIPDLNGGAIEWNYESTYLKLFEKEFQ